MTLLKVFAGYDPREARGFHAFMESLIRLSSVPLAITPLCGPQRDGTNSFTYERFLVPYLCGFDGIAVFVDGSDMLMRSDIAKLAALYDPGKAVQVIKHDYQTTARRKYIGTAMEADNRDYPCKNWSSVVLWNCAHPSHRWLLPDVVGRVDGAFLHRFQWLAPAAIGDLPPQWNTLIGEQDPGGAKIAHFTLGIPAIPHYADYMYSDEWRDAWNRAATIPATVKAQQDSAGADATDINRREPPVYATL